MKGIFVTVVDILGIFIPGFLLLVGIILLPPLTGDLLEISVIFFKDQHSWFQLLEIAKNNLAIFVTLSAIAAYVLGFLLRLCSVRILQLFTYPFWSDQLQTRVKNLETALTNSLKEVYKFDYLTNEKESQSDFELDRQAPYFHFAKRLIREGNPTLWAEAERLEADIRFTAGIFIPLIILTVDGYWYGKLTGFISCYIFSLVTGIGVGIVLVTFPSRRIREVVYDYYLALIVLQNKSQTITSNNGQTAENNRTPHPESDEQENKKSD